MITKTITIKTEDIESLLNIGKKIDATIIELQEMKNEIVSILKNRETITLDELVENVIN